MPVLFRYANGTLTSATTPLPPGATAGWWAFPGWAIFPCVTVALAVSVLVWFVLERPARAAITRGDGVAGLVAALALDATSNGGVDGAHVPLNPGSEHAPPLTGSTA